MESDTLIRAIEAHAERTGLRPSTICQYAVRNRLLYDNLQSGGECLPRTAKRLMAWIQEHSLSQQPREPGT